MTQWKIIQQLSCLVEDKTILEDEEYKKQKEVADKWYEQLEEYITKDKKLFNVFFNFDWEEGACDVIEQKIYFKEGFLLGARLMMEICGFEREGK